MPRRAALATTSLQPGWALWAAEDGEAFSMRDKCRLGKLTLVEEVVKEQRLKVCRFLVCLRDVRKEDRLR